MIHLLYEEVMNSDVAGSFSMSNSLFYYLMMGFCYLGGLTIYTTRCPERYYPGHFDICGASHQLWHISILLAIVFTYIGALINFYTRKMSTCPVPFWEKIKNNQYYCYYMLEWFLCWINKININEYYWERRIWERDLIVNKQISKKQKILYFEYSYFFNK